MGSLTFIIGGNSSGKSLHALLHASKLSKQYKNKNNIFIATCAKTKDKNLLARIANHKKEREQYLDQNWSLLEEPINLSQALENNAEKDSVILIDCLSIWLSQLMEHDQKKLEKSISSFLKTAANSVTKGCNLIIVSSEASLGGISSNKLQNIFTNTIGKLNQDLAKLSNLAELIVAGQAITLKKEQ